MNIAFIASRIRIVAVAAFTKPSPVDSHCDISSFGHLQTVIKIKKGYLFIAPYVIFIPNAHNRILAELAVTMITKNGWARLFGCFWGNKDQRRHRCILLKSNFHTLLNKAVFLGLGTRSRSFLDSVLPGYKETYLYEYDIAKAKQLLADAGHPNGIEATLEYSDLWWWEEGLAVQVKNSVAKAGITLNLKRIPATEMLTRRGPQERSLPFFTYQTVPFVLDPGYALLLSAHSNGSNNVNGYITTELDALIDEIVIEQDDDKWLASIEKAQQMIADDAVYITTFRPGQHAVMSPCISGWTWRPVVFGTYWRDLKCE